MKIAEVSKRYGVSADTLRYYERIGILQDIPRNSSGIRDYTEANCKTVEFVKCMRDAGMSIESLTEYMDLFYRGDETMERRKAILRDQREDIRRRIADLEDALSRLDYKIEHYEDVMEHERDILK
ncbi:MAG: MerR family transcriptional regulator [Eggerthellaceae bacterium]|nr:MerR family transcriptional regulator [Eggerthellaceae bacterium]